MREIVLCGGSIALVDDCDYEQLSKFRWYLLKTGSGDYAHSVEKLPERRTKMHLMHREILGAKKGEEVDHINRNTLDNRRDNLRLVNRSQNNQNGIGWVNRRTSKYKGVSPFHRPNYHPWRAQLMIDGKYIHIGYFDDEESAARAYDDAARKYFGEHARVNFPEQGERGCLVDNS